MKTVDIQQAAEQVKLAGRTFNAIVKVGEVLEQIGSLENAATEAQGRLDGLRREEAQLGEANAVARDKLNKASSTLANMQIEIESKLAEAVKNAQTKVDEVIAAAQAKADAIVASAQAKHDDTIEAVHEHEGKLSELKDNIANTQNDLDTLNAEHERVKKHLRAIVN